MAETAIQKQGGPFCRLLDRLMRRSQPQAERTPASQAVVARDSRQLAIAPEVRASAHLDGLVLLHIPSGRVFLCNRTGARIWKELSNGLDSDAIVDEISREYGVARDMAERHTTSFLTDLEQHGFVTRSVEC